MKLSIIIFGLAISFPLMANAQATSKVVATCATQTYTVGTPQYLTIAPDGTLCTASSGGGGGGAVTIADGADVTQGAIADAPASAGGTGTLSAKLRLMTTELNSIATSVASATPAGSANIGNVGGLETIGAAATGGATRAAGKDGSGNAQDIATSTTGVLDAPRAGTVSRVVTKTNLTLNTSTTVCPTATAPISTEISFTTAGVGISLAGGTLTQATVGTTATTTPDFAFNTAGAYYLLPVAPTNAITAYGAAGIVVCVQTLRQ